jgi:hypothetical protein
MWAELLSKHGLGIVMVLFVMFLFMSILKWTMSQIERTIASAERREEESRHLWDAHRAALEAHTECSKAFHQEVSTAHTFQREEHDRQLKALESIIVRLNQGRASA